MASEALTMIALGESLSNLCFDPLLFSSDSSEPPASACRAPQSFSTWSRRRSMEGRAELLQRQRSTRDVSPERTKVWTEPEPEPKNGGRKVPVIYYLSKNGHLDHPHFMEIALLSGEELHLRDVIKRLNSLRGKGIGIMYSWSCKRMYKGGFVWHDLSKDDFVYPAQGHEYILKGSEILDIDVGDVEKRIETLSPKSARDDIELSLGMKKKNVVSRSFDMNEYKVYKNELITAVGPVKSVDSPTQTNDKGQRRRIPSIEEEPVEEAVKEKEMYRYDGGVTSPPFSSSSLETVEALIKAHSRIVPVGKDEKDRHVDGSGRSEPPPSSASIVHLLSCGTISVKLGCGRSTRRSHGKERSLPRSESSSDEPNGDIVLSAIKVQAKDRFKKGNGHDFGGFYRGLDRSYSCKAGTER